MGIRNFLLFVLFVFPFKGFSFGISGPAQELVYKIVNGPSGELYVAGAFKDSILLDSAQPSSKLFSNGNWDVFIAKYDSQNNLAQYYSIGGPQADLPTDLMVVNQRVFICGTFIDSVRLSFNNPVISMGFSPLGRMNGFLVEMDLNLNYITHRTFGGNANIGSVYIDGSDNGKLVLAGSFSQWGDFSFNSAGSILSSIGTIDSYVMASDSALNFLWALSFGGQYQDVITDVDIMDSRIFVTGTFSDIVDFDPGFGVDLQYSLDGIGAFLNVLDTSGSFVSVKVISNTDNVRAIAVEIDENKNVFLAGSYNVLTDFDPGIGVFLDSAYGPNNVFLLKLDSALNYCWAKTIGGTDLTNIYDLSLDNDKLILVGYFSGTTDFNPSSQGVFLTSSGLRDAYACIYDTSGQFFWSAAMGGFFDDESWCVTGNASGGFVVGGIYMGPGDFDPTNGVDSLQNAGQADIFITRVETIPNSIRRQEIPGPLNMVVFPNPGKDRFVLTSALALVDASVEIFSVDGKLIQSFSGIQGTRFEASGNYIPGLYLIQVSSASSVNTLRWVIE